MLPFRQTILTSKALYSRYEGLEKTSNKNFYEELVGRRKQKQFGNRTGSPDGRIYRRTHDEEKS